MTSSNVIDLDHEPDDYNITDYDQEEGKVKIESTPAPTTPLNLGNSILQPKQAASPSEPMDEEALNAAQQALVAQYTASLENQDDEQIPQELGEDLSAALEQEHRFLQDKDAFEQKQRAGEATQEEERVFLKQLSAYNKRKRELENLFSDDEDPLFEPPNKRPKKKSKTKASTTSLRSAIPNLRAHHDFWENADAAEQMNTEPDYEEIAVGGGGRAAALKGLRGRVGRQAARLDMKRFRQATRSFTGKNGVAHAARSIASVTGGWKVKGMTTPLKNYQVINAAWMRAREMGANEPRGGIIADQMGLGKTVTCIANIVNGRPLKGFPTHLQPRSHTTLIIVPTNLVSQWKSELRRHTTREMKRVTWGLGMIRVFRDSQSAELDPDEFARSDVVLTTYYDVRVSWPACKIPEGLSEAEREAFWLENVFHKRGPLHRHNFLRIVLDEGHQIANPETQTARACFNLVADHKWILTGTP